MPAPQHGILDAGSRAEPDACRAAFERLPPMTPGATIGGGVVTSQAYDVLMPGPETAASAPMRRTIAFVLLASVSLSAAALPAPASASATQTHFFHVPLDDNGFAVVRFNLTAGSDLSLAGAWNGCRNGTSEMRATLGFAIFVVHDAQRVSLRALVPGETAWGDRSEVVRYGALGASGTLPTAAKSPSCDQGGVFAGARNSGATESLTLVVVSLAPVGWLDLAASWTTGVTSYDAASGVALALTKEQFQSGVHATTVPVSASVGGGLVHEASTGRDALGWFDPTGGGVGVTRSSCTQDGASCPVRPDGIHLLRADGPTDWRFAVDADARAAAPSYVLGLVTLPGDDYLR